MVSASRTLWYIGKQEQRDVQVTVAGEMEWRLRNKPITEPSAAHHTKRVNWRYIQRRLAAYCYMVERPLETRTETLRFYKQFPLRLFPLSSEFSDFAIAG